MFLRSMIDAVMPFRFQQGGVVPPKRREEVIIPFITSGIAEVFTGSREVGGDTISVNVSDHVSVRNDLILRDRPLSLTILEKMDDVPVEWVKLALPVVLASDRVDAMTKLRLAARWAEAKA